jgi:hypothetical protein
MHQSQVLQVVQCSWMMAHLPVPVAANASLSHCAPALSTRVILPAVRQTTCDLPAEYALQTPPSMLKVCFATPAGSSWGQVKEPSRIAQETPVLSAGCSSYLAPVACARDRALLLDDTSSGAGFGAGRTGTTGAGAGAGIGAGTGTGAVVAATAAHRNTLSPSMLFTGLLSGPLMVNVVDVHVLAEGRPHSESEAAGGGAVAFAFAGGGALATGGFGAAAFGGGAFPACGSGRGYERCLLETIHGVSAKASPQWYYYYPIGRHACPPRLLIAT